MKSSLKFSPTIAAEGIAERKINPKRMRRQINSQLEAKGIDTKAQQTLKLQQEQYRIERKPSAGRKKKRKRNVNLLCGRKRRRQNTGENRGLAGQFPFEKTFRHFLILSLDRGGFLCYNNFRRLANGRTTGA